MSQPQAQSIPISIETLWHGNLRAPSESTPDISDAGVSQWLTGTLPHMPPQVPSLCACLSWNGLVFSVLHSLCKEGPFHPSPALLHQPSLPIVSQESVSPPSKFSHPP